VSTQSQKRRNITYEKSEEDRCLYVFDTGCVTKTIKNVLTFLPLDKHEYSCLREDIDFGLLIAKLSVL